MRSAAPSFSIPAVFPCCYSLLFYPFPTGLARLAPQETFVSSTSIEIIANESQKQQTFLATTQGSPFSAPPQGTYSIFKFGVLAASLLSVLTSSNFSRISARSSADRVLRKVPLRMEAIFCYLLEVFPPAAGAATPKLLFSFDLDPSLSFDDQSAIIRN